MNTRIAAIAAAAVLALLLTGCSAAATGNDTEPQAGAQASQDAPASAAPEPLVAEKTAEPAETPEQEYLRVLRAAFGRDGTQIPNATDEQLLAAGSDACAQIADGADVYDVRVVEGEMVHASGSYVDSLRIAYAAIEYLCS